MEESKVSERSVARLYAVLAIFQHSHSDCSKDEIIADFLSKKDPKIEGLPVEKMHVRFFKELVGKAIDHLEEFTPIVSKHLAKDWTIEGIDPVALCILQLAVCELLYFTTNPSKVILKEYADVAAAFFTDSNSAFINGVLNVIARELRPNDVFKERKEIADERNRP